MRPILVFLIFCLIFCKCALIDRPDMEAILRGEFHDETGVNNVDYEDDSHNLTDYASRKSSDDEYNQKGKSNINKSGEEVEDNSNSNENNVKDDISEERERDAVDTSNLKAITALKVEKKQDEIVTVINKAFNDRKTFKCPRTKTELLTGTSVADLSPEDITIIAAMGDALATGIGLWPNADIEFRGASFPHGGDSTIDGLVTIPNILREFSPHLSGESHGMGSNLPDNQLNTARSNATVGSLPSQARELVRRLKTSKPNYGREWVMVIITIGTEELCWSCRGPDEYPIKESIQYLQTQIPKALIVLLGPLHVSDVHLQTVNLVKDRCPCSKNKTDGYMIDIYREWTRVFKNIQNFVENGETSRPTFGMVSYPMITVVSRFPRGLFIFDKPFLNRRGHNYATKWLWNRLIGGDKYNLSSATLSQDNYFCPSQGCPYFRTYANRVGCRPVTFEEAEENQIEISENGKLVRTPKRSRRFLYTVTGVVLFSAFCVVGILATIFYQMSKMDDHGRFEIVDEQTKKFEEAQKEEQKALLTRQNTRAQSELVLNTVPLQQLGGRHKSFRGTIEDSDD
ncbi:unnamed protein product [Caenorhabditis angaria]|uniref:Lipase_GDSL domain-containing protein n=1 Tax=Caenorhabditis angaria TaxID=860376 RepID=A0A9P1MTS3_9PELO|nr:unnamed protein product [Caenorhabditis angaria]